MRTTLPRCLVLSVCICLECNVALASFGVLSRSKPLVLDSDQNQSVKKFCQQHRKEARLRRFCSVDPGLVQAIVHGTRLTVDSCQSLFQWEPWQCDLLQDKRQHLLKKVYRETALVYALAAAGLTHSVARGCSSGRLSSRCSCNESGSRTFSATESDQNWKWGGCGDNYSFSAKFSRRLLARNKSRRPRTLRRPVDNHNLVVGIRVLRHGIRRVCKCHGLSGSCSAKTCWEELAHFPDVAKALKRKYSKAIMAQVENKPDFASTEVVSKLKKTLLTRTTQKPKWLRAVTAELQRLGRDRLVYLEESPSFCERNVLTGGMSQRRCRDHAHCEQVCCGRGHRSFSETVQERCHCRVVWCCQLECKTCTVLKYSHSCH
ncbi:hypothetical protein HPB47_010851 [Ixodes persulcatus]|uniref:Uncharacterized protein n=1 Tax=Ixodes persulcatus TaxID=34615 RepID=A0AC60NY63_IXOPE|nr:hypothetical protein HPB47_010851 [Ixodes persulcatus]